LLPLGVTTYLVMRESSAALQAAAFNQLESLREVKKSQVEQYFNQLHQQVTRTRGEHHDGRRPARVA
jgi:hypothetical protein